ncbi:vWA domain-containing protein [Longimicrobium sp.]|uniref:vWA domain-containing protein n=1 Tax=Longimicrobium sp. TaxID=2029185 RepID=UPI003B3BA7EC
MTEIRWEDPFLLHLIALFPALLLAALLLWWRRRREVAQALGDPALVRRLTATDLRRFPLIRAAFLLPAGALLGVAAAGPRWGAAETGAPGRGDVVLVLDASNSMLVADVAPSRLERERALARALVDRLAGSRVGLIAFGGSGHALSPLTSDRSAIHLYLDALSPEIVNQGGTSLDSALRQALALLGGAGEGAGPIGGSIVLVSDGEALEPPELLGAAIGNARRRGVPVHTVGIGTAAGGQVPDINPETGEREGVKRELDGTPAVSRLDEATLRRIAQETGGTFRLMPDAQGVAALASAAAQGGRAQGGRGTSLPDNRYEWFLGLALVLIALDSLAERGRRRSER